MKLAHIALAACLIAPPAGAALPMVTSAFAAASVSELGDLSAMRAIIVDTQARIAANDLAGAKASITQYETAWDQAASTLRAKSAPKWDAIDAASDLVIEGIRADAAPATLETGITALLAQLDNPGAATAGVATTDLSGKPLPCEDMLAKYRTAQSAKAAGLDATTAAKVSALEAKGLERCNADDDKRADDFFGQAIQLMGA